MKLFHIFSLSVLVAISACGRGYSEGDRAGVVSKLSNKGLIYKSWEGQLNLGGTTNTTDGIVASTWEFTVVDPTLVPKIQEAMSSGKRVNLHYVQWIQQGCSMDTDYEVTGVTVDSNEKNK